MDGSINIHENRNNVFTVNDLEHDRNFSFTTTLAPNPKLAVDFGYTYFDFFTNIDVCYASGVAGQPTTLCPIIAPAHRVRRAIGHIRVRTISFLPT